MSIEQVDIVDFVTIDQASGEILLTISDHLAWDQAEGEHLVLLQGKLNTYLRFIESGEVLNKFPEAKGRRVVINIVSKFPLSERAIQFFENAKAVVQAIGIGLVFNLFRPN